ncbi:protein FAM200B-like [Palaemon carinicauda]|uniref:protein FAM200B-like n=1 Tax=Palaemon carinicauda TaxID=392227 RepID=UPI0035B5E741
MRNGNNRPPSEPKAKYTFCQFHSNYVAMSAKKRKYNEDYIRFGFVSLRKGDTEVPQCVICYKTLSNDGMRPSRLERHLQTAHPGLVDKPKVLVNRPVYREIKKAFDTIITSETKKPLRTSHRTTSLYTITWYLIP